MKNINFISTILGLVFPVIGILLTVLYKSDNRITVLFFILFLLYEIPILIKRFLFYKKERVNPNLKNLIRTEYSMSYFFFLGLFDFRITNCRLCNYLSIACFS